MAVSSSAIAASTGRRRTRRAWPARRGPPGRSGPDGERRLEGRPRAGLVARGEERLAQRDVVEAERVALERLVGRGGDRGLVGGDRAPPGRHGRTRAARRGPGRRSRRRSSREGLVGAPCPRRGRRARATRRRGRPARSRCREPGRGSTARGRAPRGSGGARRGCVASHRLGRDVARLRGERDIGAASARVYAVTSPVMRASAASARRA